MNALDGVALGQQYGTLDAVLEFAHVARPVVGQQQIDGRGRDAFDALAQFLGVLLDKVVRQQHHVAAALGEFGHVDREDVQTIVEVAPEMALLDALLEVAVGGRDDAHVDLDRTRGAQGLELLFLQHAQQLGLGHLGEFADFIQEDSAAVGLLEAAVTALLGPGEGALLVAEEFGFDQGVGHGRAVDLDEGPGLARAAVVDGSSRQLLAGAGLAVDQNRGVAVGHLHDAGIDFLHDLAFAHDLARWRMAAMNHGLELAVLVFQPPHVHGLGNQEGHLAQHAELVFELVDIAGQLVG
ncbi:MAG: hypothetical protein BWY87_01241 [Deltaproteobacteria bacterium ADurb.Bin510]|nr:MAG: hypothetical protein BWY87_01241 [Deltaproteobacteria bacterium ADurb.Bin510]